MFIVALRAFDVEAIDEVQDEWVDLPCLILSALATCLPRSFPCRAPGSVSSFPVQLPWKADGHSESTTTILRVFCRTTLIAVFVDTHLQGLHTRFIAIWLLSCLLSASSERFVSQWLIISWTDVLPRPLGYAVVPEGLGIGATVSPSRYWMKSN